MNRAAIDVDCKQFQTKKKIRCEQEKEERKRRWNQMHANWEREKNAFQKWIYCRLTIDLIFVSGNFLVRFILFRFSFKFSNRFNRHCMRHFTVFYFIQWTNWLWIHFIRCNSLRQIHLVRSLRFDKFNKIDWTDKITR